MPPGIYPTLFSGSGGISSAAVPDPYVPVDGTMNVTGSLTLSGTALGTGAGSVTLGSAVDGTPTAPISAAWGVYATGGRTGMLIGNFVDGASAVGAVVGASADYTTAGAKILSIGDNAGTSYAEKAYVDYLGHARFGEGSNNATITSDAAGNAAGFSVGTAAQLLRTASGNASLASTANVEISAGASANTVKIVRGGLAVGAVTSVKTTNYTATVADFLIPVDVATTGSVVVTLPAANAAKGQLLTIKATATDASNTITITRAGTDTIEGVTAGDTSLILSPTASLDHVSLVSDGTSKWYLTHSSGTIT